MEHITREGHVPSVAETAARAQVSRATAYRYFPSRNKLVTAVVDYSLGPVRSWTSRERDGRARVFQLFEQTFPRFRTFEPQMRAAVQLSLEQWALERAGLLDEEPYHRGHRRKLLRLALQPLQRKLSRATLDRLTKALSVVYGIEFYIVLKDVWGCTDAEVEATALWAVTALVDAAERSG
jgi:AcrR family transcriptional regulator